MPGKRKNLPDLTGQRFGRLVAVEWLGKGDGKSSHILWRCVCDCGTEKVVREQSLLRGATTSCGCYNREVVSKLNRDAFGEAGLKQMMRGYVKGCVDRNLTFELSKDDFKELVTGNCFYCGREPSQHTNNKVGTSREFVHNGIDRIDNSIGYELGNVVTCCKICNFAKHTMGEFEFLSLVKRIYEHRKLGEFC